MTIGITKKMPRNSVARGAFILAVVLATVVAPYRAHSDEIDGGQLLSALRVHASKTGKKVVLSRGALEKSKTMEAQLLLESQPVVAINGWTVVYTEHESIGGIRKRFSHNLKVWQQVVPEVLDERIVKAFLQYMPMTSVNASISMLCKAELKLGFSEEVRLVAIDKRGTSVKELCIDFLLMLAANNIRIRIKDNELVEELDIAGPRD